MSDVRTPQPREKPDLLTLATGILAFFTALLALFAFLQMRALVDATRISERAWVTMKSPQFINLAVCQKPSGTITAKNTGKSPATDFRVRGLITLSGIPLQPGTMPLVESIERSSVGVLGPGMDFGVPFQLEHVLTPDETESIKNGKLFLLVFGEVRYRDIFGTEHRTQYCFQPNPANISGLPVVCSQWNALN